MPVPVSSIAQQHKDQGGPAAAFVCGKPLYLADVTDNLSDETDGASEKESLDHVEPDIVPGGLCLYVFFILFLMFQFLYFIRKIISFQKVPVCKPV